jgi:hypothetical protein
MDSRLMSFINVQTADDGVGEFGGEGVSRAVYRRRHIRCSCRPRGCMRIMLLLVGIIVSIAW